MTDQIVANFTTHVIADKYTPMLKQSLSLLQAKAIETVNKHNKLGENLTTIVGHSHTQKVVTLKWLEDCLLQGKKVDEE